MIKIESVDKMTMRQIAAKARAFFKPYLSQIQLMSMDRFGDHNI